MSTFWFSLVYLMVVWGFAIYSKVEQVGLGPDTIFLSALFFLLYFCLPLLHQRKWMYQSTLFLLTALVFFNFWSLAFNGFIFLILLMIAKQAIDHLQGWSLYFQLLLQYILVISPYIISPNFKLLSYITLLILPIGFLFFVWQRTNQEYALLKETSEQFQNHYRKLKRQVVIKEKNVRQEERNQIAREIHDSVGHRLTALLMQLEVQRLQATDPSSQERFTQLKSLAQSSLAETREAVKALKSEETTGLPAVIQLIRKLEAESHLSISFHVQSGALSFPLTNKQSVAVYRGIQEALTNMMRHSDARQANIDFSILGERFFRFQISNPLKEKVQIEEGFGLTAMRDRLEQLNGSLKINQVEGEFRLIGTFPMEKGE